MTKYLVVSRRKGSRRSYADGFIYPEPEYAKKIAKDMSLTGLYTMVKVVEYDSNKLVAQYTKSKQ